MSFDAPLLRIRTAVRILKGEFQMKQYQKPEVLWENFALAEHIAQCDYTIESTDEFTCKIVRDNFLDDGADFRNGFAEAKHGASVCGIIVSNYCYTNGAEAGMPRIFQS